MTTPATRASVAAAEETKQQINTKLQSMTPVINYICESINHSVAAAYDAPTCATLAAQAKAKLETLDGLMEIQFGADPQATHPEVYWVLYNAAQKLLIFISKNSVATVANQTQAPLRQSNVRLPPINIPTFGGESTQFQGFHDLFVALVHNDTSVSNVEKMQRLRSLVTDEPLKLIINLPITATSYPLAWKTLTDRYYNKVSMINGHLNALIDVKSITRPSSSALRDFTTTIRQSIGALKALSLPVTSWDVLLVYQLTRKLDYATHRAFELDHCSTSEYATLEQLLKFLDKRALALENIAASTPTHVPSTHSGTAVTHVTARANYLEPSQPSDCTSGGACSCCRRRDCSNLFACPEFIAMTIIRRREFVRAQRLCFNCLRNNHAVSSCRNTYSCRECGARHNSLLHLPPDSSESTTSAPTSSPTMVTTQSNLEEVHETDPHDSEATLTLHSQRPSSQVILSTATINVHIGQNRTLRARVLLDSASQTNFITRQLATRSGLPVTPRSLEVKGLSGHSTMIQGSVKITFSSHCSRYISTIECAVVDKITTTLPQCLIDRSQLQIPTDIILADEQFDVPGPVDVLLGADVYFYILRNQSIILGRELPVLLSTQLGYVVGGIIPSSYTAKPQAGTQALVSVSLPVCCRNLDAAIERFWQTEEVNLAETPELGPTSAEKLLLDSLDYTNGRFQVDLLFRSPNSCSTLGHSYPQALQRFYWLERRLHADHRLFCQYKNFIDEYVNLGHASYIRFQFDPTKGVEENGYFFAHHPVLRESSSTTKLRVVFDGSGRTSTGKSLNDTQLAGHPVQAPLFEILVRFRFVRIAFATDVEKMYRNFFISPHHRKFQRIIWRESPSLPLRHLELNTITYGVTSAPFSATRILNYIGEKDDRFFPSALRALKTATYIDDILTGSADLSSAKALQAELLDLFRRNNLHLRKWSSNAPELLKDLPIEDVETKVEIGHDDEVVRTLGLIWHPKPDNFQIAVPPCLFSADQKLTKQDVTSQLMSIFDPLGFVAPVVVLAKQLLQLIWAAHLDWKDPIPDELATKWQRLMHQIPHLQRCIVPRCVLPMTPESTLELHGFADACPLSYGACFYLRSISSASIDSQLLCSKSKVAPLKQLTLPRLELEAAVLLAKLFCKIRPLLPSEISVTLYSDSEITLGRIAREKVDRDVVVAHRVAQIKELTRGVEWSHVPSKLNPADPLSRGVEPAKLLDLELWWRGPSFLRESQSDYVTPRVLMSTEQRDVSHVRELLPFAPFWMAQFEHSSQYSKLVRSVAYIRRFVSRTRKIPVRKSLLVLATEYGEAEGFVIRQTQYFAFATEFNALLRKDSLRKSATYDLFPFIDGTLALRVTGRIEQADAPYDRVHQLILPAHNHVTTILFLETHERLLHASSNTTLQHLRLRFWPLGGRQEARRILFKCSDCYKLKAKTSEQLMGSLPPERLGARRAFENVGIDFAGPVNIRVSRLRRALITKGYIALFVCMATRAVHLELVSNLTTEAFLASLNRFISRRGRPSVIWSDNATNFTGARNRLNFLAHLFERTEVTPDIGQWTCNNKINWKFITPGAPHMGGLWEAGVKSAKFYLHKHFADPPMTYEEFATVLCKIEAMLNSRPTIPLSNSRDCYDYITPGHFLIQDYLTAYPSPAEVELPPGRLSFWSEIRLRADAFWAQWSRDVLNQYQQRPKWRELRRNLKVGDLVLVKDENLPNLYWKTARVIEVICGRDGLVRSARIKTPSGEYLRPIVKLCLFPESD